MNQIVYKNVADITPYANNARHNEDAVKYVANSIREFGFKNPIILDKDGVIIAGHTRYAAAKELGLTSVPCLVADDLSPAQVKAFRLADNKVGEIATWDMEKLDAELDELVVEFDMPMWDFGFELGENPADFPEDEDSSTPVGAGDENERTYSVIVTCEDEISQQSLFDELQKDGYICKMVST